MAWRRGRCQLGVYYSVLKKPLHRPHRTSRPVRRSRVYDTDNTSLYNDAGEVGVVYHQLLLQHPFSSLSTAKAVYQVV